MKKIIGNNSEKNRVAIFALTERNDPRLIRKQVLRCRKYCKKHGFEIVRVFTSVGRPMDEERNNILLKLIAYCDVEQNAVSGVVVSDLHQITRSSGVGSIIGGLYCGLIETGVTLHRVRRSPQDRFAEDMLELAAKSHKENQKHSKR